MKYAVWLILISVPCSAVWAQNPCGEIEEDAVYQQLIGDGIELTRAAQYNEAMSKFQSAQELCAFDPNVAYAIGRIHQLRGECVAAKTMYKQALSQAKSGLVPNAMPEDRITNRIDEVETHCAEGSGTEAPEKVELVRYTVTCEPRELRLFINGKAAACPATGEGAVGVFVSLEAELEGYVSHRRDIELQPSDNSIALALEPSLPNPEEERKLALLQKKEEARAFADECAGLAGKGQFDMAMEACVRAAELDPSEENEVALMEVEDAMLFEEMKQRPPHQPPPADSGMWTPAIVALSFVATGGAALLVSGVFGILIADVNSDLEDFSSGGLALSLGEHQRLLERVEDGETYETVMYASLGTAILLMLAGSLIPAFADDSGQASSGTPTWSVMASPSSAGLSVRWSL